MRGLRSRRVHASEKSQTHCHWDGWRDGVTRHARAGALCSTESSLTFLQAFFSESANRAQRDYEPDRRSCDGPALEKGPSDNHCLLTEAHSADGVLRGKEYAEALALSHCPCGRLVCGSVFGASPRISI
jgi:hypothetical protein